MVVPTIALGASAARSAHIKLPNAFCLHVNGLAPDQQSHLASMIKRPGLDKPFLLYFSADRVANKDWKPAIAEAITAGNIKLVCFDELHTYHLSDYRPENKLLWRALVRPVLQANDAFPSRDKTPILGMTATLDEFMLKDLEASILKATFTRRHWGDDAHGVMPRRNIKMAFSMRDSTQSIQRIADDVLAASEAGTLIIYCNFASDAARLEESLVLPANCDAVALTGGTGDIMKGAYVRSMMGMAGAGSNMNVRVIAATAAADTGLDVDTISRVVRRGIAPHLASVSQERGRIRHLGNDGDYRYDMLVTLSSFTMLVAQRWSEPDKESRARQLAAVMEVLRMCVLDVGCIHDYLERRFQDPSRRWRGGIGRCKEMCWACNRDLLDPRRRSARPATRGGVTSIVTVALQNGPAPAAVVGAALYGGKKFVWRGCSSSVQTEDADFLVLQLIATGILKYHVKENNAEQAMPSVLLSWAGAAPGPGVALARDEAPRWVDIERGYSPSGEPPPPPVGAPGGVQREAAGVKKKRALEKVEAFCLSSPAVRGWKRQVSLKSRYDNGATSVACDVCGAWWIMPEGGSIPDNDVWDCSMAGGEGEGWGVAGWWAAQSGNYCEEARSALHW